MDLAKVSSAKRLDYLLKDGVPLLTLVKIGGHILMYVGDYQAADGSKVAMSYQQMWGLAPKDRSYRAVLGQSVFLPLLLSYPEDKELYPELANSQFYLVYLNQFPVKKLKQGLNELLY